MEKHKAGTAGRYGCPRRTLSKKGWTERPARAANRGGVAAGRCGYARRALFGKLVGQSMLVAISVSCY